MPEDLKMIVYISSAKSELPKAEFEKILQKARRNNAAANITGLTMVHEGNIFQVLEGPSTAVDATFSRIQNDGRHRGVLCLLNELITKRSFPDWHMGYARPCDMTEESRKSIVKLSEIKSRIASMGVNNTKIKMLIEAYLRGFRQV